MKQYTIEVISYVTVTCKDDIDIKDIPMKLDVFDKTEDEDSPVEEVNETVIVERQVTQIVDI